MSNTNDKAPESNPETKKNGGNGYPFPTQNQIVEELRASSQFRLECLQILVGRQTGDEQETKTTKHTNKRGLRCSEASWMPTLLSKITNSPDEVTSDEYNRLERTLPFYRKQLAAHFRSAMIEQNPELAQQAAKFGL